jgi:hypothetical protein
MITTITSLRRVAVTLALTGVTAFGAVAIAPAAFADEATSVTEAAPEVASPEVAAPEVAAPEVAAPGAVVPEVAPAPEAAPVVPAAPVAESAPAPAPVVTPPLVVIGKDGMPVKAPKVCTAKDLSEYAAKLAKANAQAAPYLRAAQLLRQAATALRAEVPTLNPGHARKALALAEASELAASKLEAQAQAIVSKVGGVGCITVTAPGGRF